MAKKNGISVYLIKENYTNPSQIVEDIDELFQTVIDGVGILYCGTSRTHKPSWIKNFFGSTIGNEIDLWNSSSKALLLTNIEVEENITRTFAIPFGFGWTMLKRDAYEERFGLKTTLNIIDDLIIKRIDKRNLTAVPKDTSEQLSKAGSALDFGIDIEQDLIQAVTGKSKYDLYGHNVSGKDSLKLSVPVDSLNISDFLIECYNSYLSEDYKINFGWIDQISEVRNPRTIKLLNGQLFEQIRNRDFDKTWMSVPELVDWVEIQGFSYSKNNDVTLDDILIEDFLASLSKDEINGLDESTLRKYIYCFSSTNDQVRHRWQALDCLYSEITSQETGNTYILSNKKWYEVQRDFANLINQNYRAIRDTAIALPLPTYSHGNEADYNESVAKSDKRLFCMDKKIIRHGGGQSQIEFCDLLTEDRKIIHVKKYGTSGVLSHLFQQGAVSGELFLADKEFRVKVNAMLPAKFRIDLRTTPRAQDYSIIYAIISTSDAPLEIPFFSKVGIRNAKRKLETFGYKVYLHKIGTVV